MHRVWSSTLTQREPTSTTPTRYGPASYFSKESDLLLSLLRFMKVAPTPQSGLTVEHLRAFLAVAEHQHVTRAAEELGLTQPAVSHQLKALERALGLAVFERL